MSQTCSSDSFQSNLTRRIEWLAAFLQLIFPDEVPCANPQLLALLHLAQELRETEIFRLTESLCEKYSRDALIKHIVKASHASDDPAFARYIEIMDDFSGKSAAIVGSGVLYVLHEAEQDMLNQVGKLMSGINVSADIKALTGEWFDFRVTACPSLFLPPPQTGRHGVCLEDNGITRIYLHFGYPLQEDPLRYGIDRAWLIGGAWHYAINRYLRTPWRQIRSELSAMDELAAAAAELLQPVRQPVQWPDILAEHLNIAFKCRLSARTGVPDTVHRAFVQTRGLILFDWFDQWLERHDPKQISLREYLLRLPEDFRRERAEWERLAAVPPKRPLTINMALASLQGKQATLVVPNAWPDEVCASIQRGWRMLGIPMMDYGAWLASENALRIPAIIFGQPGENAFIGGILSEKKLNWSDSIGEATDPLLIMLSAPEPADSSWRIAVAVKHPETAASFPLETALQLTNTYTVFDGAKKIGSDRVTLSRNR